jgi:mono/diheme cytochrome c family protein
MNQLPSIAAALALLGCGGTAFAQNVDNGQRLSERWCAGCHSIGTTAPRRAMAAPPFAAIAAKDNVTADMIVSFLNLPHATMPNVPLHGNDAQDIAAFILQARN